MKYILGVLLLISVMSSNIFAQSKREIKTKADFGVVLNEDGDFAFLDPNPVVATKLLNANIDGHASLGIKTYVFSVGAGSDVLYYPTQVASTYGWRETKYEKENESWKARVNSARACIAAGMDAVQIAGMAAKRNHLLFIPSLRMNDSHFMADPEQYPLTGKFWLENKDLIIKQSPISFNKDYGNLLDFSHEKVRNFRLAEVDEVLQRNKQYIDGFELDFNRVQVFFPNGKSATGKDLITDLVRKVRKSLSKLSKELGRPLYLFVRVPPSEASCNWAGLDIETWMKEGLIDMITPSQLMTLAHEMPIKELIQKAHKYSIQVYPSLFPRTSYRTSLDPSSNNLGLDLKHERIASMSEILGAAANYRWMGADGYYLFNFKGGDHDEGFRPHPNWMYALVAGLKQNKVDAGTKIFAITKTYYNDNLEPSYAYVKQLPKKISEQNSFSILVGELPGESIFPVKNCIIRIGVKGLKNDSLKIAFNGYRVNQIMHVYHQLIDAGKNRPVDLAEDSYVFAIDDLNMVKKGENIIVIEQNNIVVTDIELAYAYDSSLSNWMLGKKAAPINSSIKK